MSTFDVQMNQSMIDQRSKFADTIKVKTAYMLKIFDVHLKFDDFLFLCRDTTKKRVSWLSGYDTVNWSHGDEPGRKKTENANQRARLHELWQ
jgi:hypothetical protein